jgi:hypothetical protein
MKANFDPLVSYGFAAMLLCLAASGSAHAVDADKHAQGGLLMAAADEEDEEDEEEEAVNLRDRVRDIQRWMNRRESERKGEAPSLDVAPTRPYPRYSRHRGNDDSSSRSPEASVRVRLNDAPQASHSRHHHSRTATHHRGYQHTYRPKSHYRHHASSGTRHTVRHSHSARVYRPKSQHGHRHHANSGYRHKVHHGVVQGRHHAHSGRLRHHAKVHGWHPAAAHPSRHRHSGKATRHPGFHARKSAHHSGRHGMKAVAAKHRPMAHHSAGKKGHSRRR